MIEFQPLEKPATSPGLVLRIGDQDSRYLRVTHVFEECVYVMWVNEPEQARYARRPSKMLLKELKKLASSSSATWGRIALPSALSVSPVPESERAQELNAAWLLIKPLTENFDLETNLTRSRFTYLIRERSEAIQANFLTLLRMILRYYYFGRTRLALLPLPPGVRQEKGGYSNIVKESSGEVRKPKRRGRQAILSEDLGINDFVVLDDDISDMVDCLKTCLRKGPTYRTLAHEQYLATNFRLRHPEKHTAYLTGKLPEPVTARQFSYYINKYAVLDDDLARNLRSQERKQGYLGSTQASGPGEVYEIDATIGRLHLVSDEELPTLLGKPTIYLIIDRWSRFVLSIYLSLRSPSYEEVRHALLIAFTSREQRFKNLGVDIDDERWPIGRMPAVLCPDRGSDFMSHSMEQSVVQDLLIELTPLPPLCPDGKPIVERFIREIKRRMAASGIKGVYADRPIDPHSKRAARKAEAAAVHSLPEAYRLLIEIVDDHNNRPHTTLKRRRELSLNNVPPTPKEAYLWGLKNITGLRRAPLTDDDYKKLLLSTDKASISNGVLRYKQRPYLPENEAAYDIAKKSTTRAQSIDIRLDKTDPHEIYVVTTRREWALFRITEGSAKELAKITLDEEDLLSSQTSKLWAKAEHKSRVARVAAKSTRKSVKQKGTATKVDRQELLVARQKETAAIKRKVIGNDDPKKSKIEVVSRTSNWTDIEEKERLSNLELIRKHRSKK
jgi:transposase InsO family protein